MLNQQLGFCKTMMEQLTSLPGWAKIRNCIPILLLFFPLPPPPSPPFFFISFPSFPTFCGFMLVFIGWRVLPPGTGPSLRCISSFTVNSIDGDAFECNNCMKKWLGDCTRQMSNAYMLQIIILLLAQWPWRFNCALGYRVWPASKVNFEMLLFRDGIQLFLRWLWELLLWRQTFPLHGNTGICLIWVCHTMYHSDVGQGSCSILATISKRVCLINHHHQLVSAPPLSSGCDVYFHIRLDKRQLSFSACYAPVVLC